MARTPGSHWVRPPEPATGESREANRLELFFDLAYVFVIAELALGFGKDLTWAGFGTFAGLFAMIFFAWVGFTVYANRFDTDDVVFRITRLAATLAIAGCAASAAEATGKFILQFAVCYLLARALLLVLYLRAWLHVAEARRTTTVYIACSTVTCAMLTASLFVGLPERYWLWALAIAADAAAPIVA